MIERDRLYTVDEFERLIDLPENADRRYELINGEIIEKPMPTQEHGSLAANVGSPIHVRMKGDKLGRDGPEIRYRIPDDPLNSLMPDWSFTLGLDKPVVVEGAVLRMPDFALEVMSPNDSLAKMREKAKIYLRNGTRLVWLILPRQQVIEVYRADGFEGVYTVEDDLDFGDLLPELVIPVRDIFDV